MGKKLRINGKMQEHREDKTIEQLKKDAGFAANDLVLVDDGQGLPDTLHDRDRVEDIPDGAPVVAQPSPDNLFG